MDHEIGAAIANDIRRFAVISSRWPYSAQLQRCCVDMSRIEPYRAENGDGHLDLRVRFGRRLAVAVREPLARTLRISRKVSQRLLMHQSV
jgi:hypothetical protein